MMLKMILCSKCLNLMCTCKNIFKIFVSTIFVRENIKYYTQCVKTETLKLKIIL